MYEKFELNNIRPHHLLIFKELSEGEDFCLHLLLLFIFVSTIHLHYFFWG
jgi:hypothetical protein